MATADSKDVTETPQAEIFRTEIINYFVTCPLCLEEYKDPTDLPYLCPKDWKRIGNKCFFLSSYQTSCLQASKRCTALHYKARLATARNKHEFKTLTKQLVFPATQHTRSYFIGLDDLDHPSSFKFSDGSPLGGYNEWIPDLSNTERTGCVILDHEESFMWRGVDKTKHEDYFICEINKEAGHER
ncbi:low affinity immunoglobulin epsilon Fc receptor-like [Lingula anatina]|uniref:Low affinity immunoglobulin epsilon Fc receptor-like n=1 Tax=Lingula anatina TaxID=7574 RepID=A0A1S3JFV2_LINAN|nr:low affinity immunoglobulin epsilon Fc receptor-like [Lingula anatina]|eukprot:XP_013409277.1 low affinity immunoglobulin epsilon Fc receptor-like [Lingula anatina]